jgi:hypothetical protein
VSAPDYLWPARPEYLRRCSVVVPYGEGLVAVVVEIDGNDLLLTGQLGGGGWKAAHAVRIDLRDVTARAHAAWAYTRATTRGLELHFNGKMYLWAGELSSLPGDAVAMYEILCCMACGGESVTVDEARVALAWAERVAGVAS